MADDDALNLRVGEVELQRFLEPLQLLRIELVRGGVIEANEIHGGLVPVKVSGDFARAGIVAEALFLQHRLVEPVGELDNILFAGLGWSGVVVSDAEKTGSEPKAAI